MSGVKELLVTEADGTISFGDYELAQKTKLSDVEIKGDLYKVKTFREMTKLEKNGMLIYESDPGTAVRHFSQSSSTITFTVETPEDTQVILGLGEDASYHVTLNDVDTGIERTGMGGKLVLSLESGTTKVRVEREG